jgi:hypothetical protein
VWLPALASAQQLDPSAAGEAPSVSEDAPPSPVAVPLPEPATEGDASERVAENLDEEPGRPRNLLIPNLELFFPEGDFELRLRRLQNRVSFEGQVNYNFIDGDISAYLRYRYYGYRRAYRFGVFDTLEFRDFQNSDEFERVRGGLFLAQWPHSYNHRTFLLTEVDNITTNQERAQTNGQVSSVNTFVRLSFQVGTPDDDRSNAIIGEDRAEVLRLFTPYRKIGPGDWGATTALTWGFDFLGGEFDYVRLEAQGLKRFELPRSSFLFGRLRAGTFLRKASNPDPVSDDPRDAFLIPRREFFRLDGRENLKGLGRRVRGTDEINTTWELLWPWFVEDNRRHLGADWQTWYWVAYSGYGIAGFDRSIYSDFSNYVVDVGLGFQSSFQVKQYTLFFSALLAQELDPDADLELRLSIKSFH